MMEKNLKHSQVDKEKLKKSKKMKKKAIGANKIVRK